MLSNLARTLLAVAAFILIGSALLHASAYGKVDAGISASGLSPLLGNAYRALWMADSTTAGAVGLLAAVFAARPALATPAVILLLALIPACTGVFVYRYLGRFPPGHLMAMATVLMVVAALVPRRALAAPAVGA
jgi:hypothetical protein